MTRRQVTEKRLLRCQAKTLTPCARLPSGKATRPRWPMIVLLSRSQCMIEALIHPPRDSEHSGESVGPDVYGDGTGEA
jgi:hypothetical protein